MQTNAVPAAPAAQRPKLKDIIHALSGEMLRLAPGPLAELRRLDIDTPGSPAYWRLAACCGFLDDAACDEWMHIVKIMAILTPKGERNENDRLHDKEIGLGQALCDGGVSKWPDAGNGAALRPFYSEERLARLLAQPKHLRADTLERVARMLARGRTRDQGINCAEIALLLFKKDDTKILQSIARDYYRRLDKAQSSPENKDNQ